MPFDVKPRMLVALVALLSLQVNAQQPLYAQCGGTGWTGATTCVSGATCTASNQFYSQCLPDTAAAPAPAATTVAAPPAVVTPITGYLQPVSGTASFTMYSGCAQPACGVASSGFTAAVSQLTFGSVPGIGPGDACGRCFALTGTADPYSPAFTGPFGASVVVKVTDMCPVAGNSVFCAQSTADPVNTFGEPVHFDLCEDTGAAAVFFPSGHGALTGTFQEVSCSEWTGTDGPSLWLGSCIKGETAALWPAVGCGNQGTPPS